MDSEHVLLQGFPGSAGHTWAKFAMTGMFPAANVSSTSLSKPQPDEQG